MPTSNARWKQVSVKAKAFLIGILDTLDKKF